MRFPNHLVLDFENRNKLETNWSYKFIHQKQYYPYIFKLKSETFKKDISKGFFGKPDRYTLSFSTDNLVKPKSLNPNLKINLMSLPSPLIDNKATLKAFLMNKSSFESKNEYLIYYRHVFQRIYTSLNNFSFRNPQNNVSNSIFNLVNINFLRKERLYTKLKYSRSPAYDMVSGGTAALLAAFVGFLVSEKYGFELVDSGDFYYLFMYIVFLAFSIKPLLTVISYQDSFSKIISLKPLFTFYTTLFYFLIKKVK